MLSEPDQRIVRLIARMSFLTADQVCRRYYSPGSIKGVKARMKNLVDCGVLIRRGWQPLMEPTYGGSQPYVYSLSSSTREELLRIGVLPQTRSRPSEKTKHYPNHTLAVNDVLIAAERLESFDHFIHERTIQRMSISYKPDAYLQFQAPDKPRAFLLEVDMDSEWPDYWNRKIKRMVRFINSDAYSFPYFDGVLIVGTTAARTTKLKEWIEKGLESHRLKASHLFHYAALDDAKRPEVFHAIL